MQKTTTPRFSGSGFGGGSPKSTKDNLFSTDQVEVVLGIGEGQIKGLAEGAKSFFIGDTPLVDVGGKPNFEDFELKIYDGRPGGQEIKSKLGGFGSSTTVSTELATNVPVTRQGLQTNIDYIDFRLVVARLVKENEKGTFEHIGRLRIEYKAASSSTWIKATTFLTNPPPTEDDDGNGIWTFHPGDRVTRVTPAAGDRKVVWSATEPTGAVKGDTWFDLDDANRPRVHNGTAFALPTSLTAATFFGTFPGWSWTEIDTASATGDQQSIKRAYAASEPPASGALRGDFFLNTATNKVYLHNGSTWVVAGTTLKPDNPFGDDDDVTSVEGEIQIKGKTTSSYVKELRLPVARIAEGYDLRVTKLSPPNTEELFFDVTWESFQQISKDPMVFEDLAVAHLVGRSSEQFSSLPDFSGIYDGRIVKVPSNYNEVARTYTGVWDGTWKLAYTNNPAYIANDLVDNDRYGMNAYYPVTINKWDVYEAGQWCDVRTEDDRPRFTFNLTLTDPQGGREAVDFICGIFGGRFFDDGNGFATIKLDRDGEAVAIFTPENVVEGVFTYSFTDITSRYNDITATFINPDLNWNEDRRRVFEQEHIDQYGRIPLNFVAVGCTDPDEAIARARYKLITGTREFTIVNFKTNRMGLYLSPYDIILIGDDEAGGGPTGRVKAALGSSFTVRDPLYLEPGFSYQACFQIVGENAAYEVVKVPVSVGQTGTNLLTVMLDGALPAELPDDAVFTIETTDGSTAPRPFRVMSISEAEGNPDLIDITAVAINRSKWAYVDGTIEYGDTEEHYEVKLNAKPAPVPAVRVEASQKKRAGGVVHNLVLDWDASPSSVTNRYRVFAARNQSPPVLLSETTERRFEWYDVPLGEYVFHVTAVSITGRESAPTYVEHRLIGDYKVVEGVTGLRMVDEPSGTIFESRSPRFVWNASKSPDHETYVVQILDESDGLLRQETPTKTEFTYEFGWNEADHGGTAARVFKVQVASRDQYGFLSKFSQIVVNNPAPAAPTDQGVEPTVGGMVISVAEPGKRDYVATLIHRSTTSGFTPNSDNLIYRGTGGNVFYPAEDGQTYYIRAAHSDVFGENDLNYGAEMTVTIPSFAFDTDPPAIPTGLALSSAITDGVCKLVATCDANTEDDLAGYVFEIKEGAGNDVGFPTNGPRYEWVVKPGITYTVRVLAFDQSQNKSDFCVPETLPGALDTVPPATPTGLTAIPGIDAIWLKWNANAETDFSHYEIFENAVNDFATATLLGTTKATTQPRTGLDIETTRYYWLKAVDTSGNKSDETTSATATTGTIPGADVEVNLLGIAFSTNASLNRISWTAGTAAHGVVGETPTETAISAGFADWTSGTVYVYYVPGNSTLSSHTNLATVYSSGGIIAASYRGGHDQQVANGKPLIHGSTLVANSIGAGQLVTGSAVITGSAQIANAIIGTAHIDKISAVKIEAGTTLSGEVLVSGRSLSSIVSEVFYDDMGADRAPWVVHSGSGTLTYGTGSGYPTAGRGLVLNGPAGARPADLIPFDRSKLYRVTARVWTHTYTGGLYLGFVEFDSAKAVLGEAFPLANNVDQQGVVLGGAGWVDIVAYIKGTDVAATNAAGVTRTGTVATGTNNTIASPAKLINGTVWIKPSLYASWPAGTGGIQVDMFRVEVVNEDAAAIVNAGTTLIQPGKVLISGSTTLSSWTHGGDATLIDGGKIAANTIAANTAVFGLRGINIDGIQFEANSPAANRLSWTTGTISYIGDDGNIATFTIPAGNTSIATTDKRYFIYIKGTSAIQSTTDPAVAHNASSVVILAIYNGGTDLVVNVGRTVIDGSHIKTGTITADQVDALSIRSAVLIAEAVKAEHLAANSVTAKHLLVTDHTNLVPDPFFKLGTLDAWDAIPPTTEKVFRTDGVATGRGYNLSPTYLECKGANSNPALLTKRFDVIAGRQYLLEGVVIRNASSGSHRMAMAFYNGSGTLTGSQYIDWTVADPSNTQIRKTLVCTPPAGTVSASIAFNNAATTVVGSYYVSYAGLTRMYGGELIVDGSIIGQHLDVTSAKAVILHAGSITADMLTVGASGNYLENSDLTAGTTNWGMGTTNATSALTIRTDTYAPPGGAIQMLQNNATATGYADLFQLDVSGAVRYWDVVAGESYQLSAYLLGHRCNGQLYIEWRNASDAVISYSSQAVTLNQNTNPNYLLSGYLRAWVKGVAPATAVKARVFVRKYATLTSTNSFLWVARPFFGSALPNQTEPSAWTNTGVTKIGPGHLSVSSLSTISANIGEATAGIIRSADSKFIINLNAGTLEIFV
jgi:predicted phage tail protein